MRRYTNRYHRPPVRRRRRRIQPQRFIIFILIVAAIVVGIVLAVMFFTQSGPFERKAEPITEPTATPAPYVQPEVPASPLPSASQAMTQGAVPAAVGATQPSAFGFETDIQVNGQMVDSYQRQAPISFPPAAQYTELKGVTTFRGNNYRDMASWGAANVSEKTLSKVWKVDTGNLTRWSGSGYPSQPLVVQWDADMRQMMNMYDDKKSKDNLVEVIYPTMDGKIYFLDIDDGSATRDPIEMGFSVKGTASLDPRGYPLLYVGQGVGMPGDYSWDDTYMYAYSLIDGKVLWKYGSAKKDDFSYRDSWQAFDSSPLIAADADTLVWPGESGVLYTVVLNSDFDRAAGTVSISAEEPVKYRYTTPLNKDDSAGNKERWWGMENSASAWKNYIYFTDNGGWLQCIDLNTMELVFAQDVTDDSDCSPVLEADGDNLYLYTGSESDKTVPEGEESGTAYIRKINALTGEIMWEKPHTCFFVEKIDGGMMATPILGKGNMEGMVVYTVARTGSKDAGLIIAYNKNTGEEIWSSEMKRYGWSSPVVAYTPDGSGYIIQCDSGGNATLYDGATGEELDKIGLSSGNMEASPVLFNDMMVIGTRDEEILGVRIQ